MNTIKSNIFNIILTIILIIFAYLGYFPFNLKKTIIIHYKFYDGIHYAFNIPNTPNGDYYCPLQVKEEQIYKKNQINRLKQERNEINLSLINIRKEIDLSPAHMAINYPLYRYNLTKFDINRLRNLQKIEATLTENLRNKDAEIESQTEKFYADCKRIDKL